MEQLKTKLQAIKAEKDKLDANYISSLLTVFGVNGNLTELGNNLNTALENTENKSAENKFIFKTRNVGADIILRKQYGVNLPITYEQLANIIGLTSEKISKGQNILGIEGTVEPKGDAIKLYKDFNSVFNNVLYEDNKTTMKSQFITKKGYFASGIPWELDLHLLLRYRDNVAIKQGVVLMKVTNIDSDNNVTFSILGYVEDAETDITTTEDYQTCMTLANDILGVTE